MKDQMESVSRPDTALPTPHTSHMSYSRCNAHAIVIFAVGIGGECFEVGQYSVV